MADKPGFIQAVNAHMERLKNAPAGGTLAPAQPPPPSPATIQRAINSTATRAVEMSPWAGKKTGV